MAKEYRLYPLSSPTGKAIPMDIIKPAEHVAYAISGSAWLNPVQFTTVEIEEHFLTLFATKDCVISFDPTTPVADIDAGTLFLPANMLVQTVAPTQYISAIGSNVGKLHINVLELWDSLITEVQNQYG